MLPRSGHMQLIECVPNISEGRDQGIIAHIAQAISSVEGAYLLHTDIGKSVNRTVFTIAGAPIPTIEAVFNAIAMASKLIDMRNHKGSHPRIGAADVCPIVPLANVTINECIELSKKLALRVGQELKIPVYLYADSAQSPERKDLACIRKGEYESLMLRMSAPGFKSDFGPKEFNAKSGATVIGARSSYIAYNVNLNTSDLKIAKAIAAAIRQSRQYNKQHLSESIKKAGQILNVETVTWQECQAIGWYIDEYKCCQISFNLLDYKKTSLHQAYLGVNSLASMQGIVVTGSEIIGLAPLPALLDTGSFAMRSDNKLLKSDASEEALLNAAIKFLKLDAFHSFITEEKVLEYRLAQFGLSLS